MWALYVDRKLLRTNDIDHKMREAIDWAYNLSASKLGKITKLSTTEVHYQAGGRNYVLKFIKALVPERFL